LNLKSEVLDFLIKLYIKGFINWEENLNCNYKQNNHQKRSYFKRVKIRWNLTIIIKTKATITLRDISKRLSLSETNSKATLYLVEHNFRMQLEITPQVLEIQDPKCSLFNMLPTKEI